MTDRLLSGFSLREAMVLAKQVKERLSVAVMKGIARQLGRAAGCSVRSAPLLNPVEWRQESEQGPILTPDDLLLAVQEEPTPSDMQLDPGAGPGPPNPTTV